MSATILRSTRVFLQRYPDGPSVHSEEPSVRIRPFESSDTDDVNNILTTHYPWTEYDTDFEVDPAKVTSHGVAVVATRDGDFCGFAWWLPSGAFDRSGYVKLVGVHRDHQSAGVGSALMEAAEAAMFEGDGSGDVFLLVSAFNELARSFYDRRGYVEIGRITGYVEDGIDELLLRKPAEEA